MIKQLGEQGVVFTGGSLAQTQTFLDDEVRRWGTIIKAANIKAE